MALLKGKTSFIKIIASELKEISDLCRLTEITDEQFSSAASD